MPTTRHVLAPLAAAAAATLLTSCGGGPPELDEAMDAVCDEGTVAEPEPPALENDPEEWAVPVSEVECTAGDVEILGREFEADPDDRLSGESDMQQSDDGGVLWRAVAGQDGQWVVVQMSSLTVEDEDGPGPEELQPLTELGFEVGA